MEWGAFDSSVGHVHRSSSEASGERTTRTRVLAGNNREPRQN